MNNRILNLRVEKGGECIGRLESRWSHWWQ